MRGCESRISLRSSRLRTRLDRHPREGGDPYSVTDRKTAAYGSPGLALARSPGTTAGQLLLTLILSLNIVLSVRSTEGRSHEASCGWDRMRRLRACFPQSTHPGGTGAPLGGQYGPPARSLADGWPSGAPEAASVRPPETVANPMRRKASRERRPAKSAARCRKEDAVMARREAPRALEREHGHRKNNGCATWRAIPLTLSKG